MAYDFFEGKSDVEIELDFDAIFAEAAEKKRLYKEAHKKKNPVGRPKKKGRKGRYYKARYKPPYKTNTLEVNGKKLPTTTTAITYEVCIMIYNRVRDTTVFRFTDKKEMLSSYYSLKHMKEKHNLEFDYCKDGLDIYVRNNTVYDDEEEE